MEQKGTAVLYAGGNGTETRIGLANITSPQYVQMKYSKAGSRGDTGGEVIAVFLSWGNRPL